MSVGFPNLARMAYDVPATVGRRIERLGSDGLRLASLPIHRNVWKEYRKWTYDSELDGDVRIRGATEDSAPRTKNEIG
jgi:hypothetical protein